MKLPKIPKREIKDLCPLSFSGPAGGGICVYDKCQWWDKSNNQCVVQTIAQKK